MEEIATYYVTLKPIREGGVSPIGMKNIAFVNDPAVEEVGIYLNYHDKKIVADDETKVALFDYLKGCGIEKPAHWREVSDEEYLEARELDLGAGDPLESTNDFEKKDGSGRWLVRYKYDGPNDEKTRSFCMEILSLGRLYTEEEISNGLSNPEFGNYPIFNYKGSYGCRHVWQRMIFFEDYEDKEVRRVGNVPQVVSRLDDKDARTLNAFLSKDEKMQVVAPLLIPEKDIFRNDEIGRYNMRFTKEAILDLQKVAVDNKVFDKEDLFKDTHEGGKAPSFVIDQWVSMSADDKAYTTYGLNITRNPIGTWFVHSQITDKTYWEKEIKLNKKYAYSIEALMNLSIIKMSKMTTEQIVLPDGEHLINGTIYVVKDGAVVEAKEVTSEQEDVIEEVVTEGLNEETKEEETLNETTEEEVLNEDETKEEETLNEDEKPLEEMEDANTEGEASEDDRVAKLEQQQEEILSEIAKIRAEVEAPKEEEVAVDMSDKRPTWKRISDGINAYKKNR
jgi:hypothetical protein